MTSYTTNKAFIKPAKGEFNDAWAGPLNSDWDIADVAFGGTLGVSLTSSNYTIDTTLGQQQNVRILLTGSLSANVRVIFPAGISGFYIVQNNTSGAYTVTLSSAGGTPGTTVLTEQGRTVFVFTDGSNVFYADDSRVALTAGTGITITGTTNLTISLTVPVAAANGGTGNSTYAIGDILYASGTSTLSRLASVATGNALLAGGVGAAPAWGKVDLTTTVTGQLPIASGGTGATSASGAFNNLAPTTTQGDLIVRGASGNVRLPVGAASTVLQSTGTDPAWTAPTGTGSLVAANSPALTGTPTAPTATAGTNTTQIATTAYVQTAIAGIIAGAVPAGIIAMWSGLITALPSGWKLCDGTNGTPDLRDKFVIGAGSTYIIGATGGSATSTLAETNLPAHTHAVSITGTTASAGTHTHGVTDSGHTHTLGNAIQNTVGTSNLTGGGVIGVATATTNAATTGITIDSAGAHTHGFTVSGNTGSTGSGTSFTNLPPYYALAFIMKT